MPRHCALTKDMRWASNILWYIARQSSILSMTTGRFMSASSSPFFSLILLMLYQKSENWAAASRRKGITSWKFCQSLISVQLQCLWRESIHLEYPKSASLLFWIKIVDVQESLCRVAGLCWAGNQTDWKFKLILFYFSGVDRGKSMYFKTSDLCLVNTT